jgi:carbonic anhydrase
MSQSDPSRILVTGDPRCHWSYDGDTNPRNWGTLAQNGGTLCFPLCADRDTSQQSPIDIQTDTLTVDPTLPTLVFRYSRTTVNVTDGHNNFTAHFPSGSDNTLFYKGTTYNLVSFHFHHPAEHHANGVAMGPIEAHLVHSAGTPRQTQSLVVAVFMAIPSANRDDGRILAELVDNAGKSIAVDATQFLPNNCPYFTYQGSLTTPPCTESVTWLLVDMGMPVHMDHVQKFKSGLEAKYQHGYNARGVQRLNGRTVYSSAVAAIGGFAASLGRHSPPAGQ